MKKTITFMLLLLMAGAAMSQGSFTCGEQISDVEGNTYETVEIGGLCWTKENMKSKTYSDGTPIAKAMIYSSSMYPDTNANLATYGRLYTWFSAVNVPEGSSSKPTRDANGFIQGICPDGWHIPTVGDMNKLNVNSTESLRSVELWLQPNNNTNSTGFSSLPAGYYSNTTNRFEVLLGYTYYWSDSSSTPEFAIACDVNYFCDVAKNEQKTTGDGVSVRCVKDYSLSANTFTCGTDKVTDVEGHDYNTVLIGEQCWMRENLRTTKYADGTAITASLGNPASTSTPYYYDYTESGFDLKERGLLYNWAAANLVCPDGWHLPSDAEWNIMEQTVSNDNGDWVNNTGWRGTHAGKLAGGDKWQTSTNNNAPGNRTPSHTDRNSSGFSAVPAGDGYGSSIVGAGVHAYFWSSSQNGSSNAWGRDLICNDVSVARRTYNKGNGFSVRCVKDKKRTLPTVTTAAVSNVTVIGATLGGEVTDDGGANVTVRGVCWSTSQNPTIADSHTTDGSGTGSFTVSIMGLVESTTYYVRAYAINSVDTAYGNEVSFTTPYFICGISQVTDVDKNFYNTVMIDKQCWMKENLRTTKYANGTAIPAGVDTSKTKPYYYDYTGTDIPLEQRGYLYNWPAVMNGASSSNEVPSKVQGICPDGWHLPSDAEWIKMEKFVSGSDWQDSYENIATWRGTHAGKLAGGDKWKTTTNINAPGNMNYTERNASGFSAVPAGGYKSSSLFEGAGVNAYFWSSTKHNYIVAAYKRILHYRDQKVAKDFDAIHMGHSVRCVRNGDEKSCPGTPTVTDIDDNVYATVQIGDQCWMRENLRTTKYPDGSSVTQGGNNASGTEGFYYDYTIPIALKHRGYYYNWTAANNVCPNGWHLPSDEEWNTMEKAVSGSDWQDSYANTTDYRGTHAGKLAHEAWWENSDVANAPGNINYTERNASGFSAVAAGGAYGELFPQSNKAYFWSSTPGPNNEGASCRVLYGDKAGVERSYYGKFNGYSVRCVKN